MEIQDLILNLHGESPSGKDITVLNAEESFLPTLLDLHARFPNLRIILEHCTTAAAVAAVKNCGPQVAATITPHHLCLTVDDWAGDPFCFCKPVAKLPSDREALLRAAASGDPKFFLGTDSAPHPIAAKTGAKIAAGVFSQPYASQLVLDSFELGCERGILTEEDITKEVLEGFLSGFGRAFYRAPDERGEQIVLLRGEEVIVDVVTGEGSGKGGGVQIVPFRRGRRTWSLRWVV